MLRLFGRGPRGAFAANRLTPPVAAKRTAVAELFGQRRTDPYAWLRDEDWRKVLRDPGALATEIRAHLEAENAYYDEGVRHLGQLRDALFEEMKGRIKEDDSSPPQPDGPYAYYTRFREGGEHPIFARRPRDGGAEQLLFDGDKEKGDAEFFNVAAVIHSPDHAKIAYAVDRIGSEYFDVRIRDVSSAAEAPESILNTDGYVVWSADSGSFLYVERDDNQRPKRVRRHVLGADPSADEVVYEESDDAYFLSIDISQSREFIFIVSSNGTSSEVRFVRSDAAAGAAPLLIEPRRADVIYYAEHHDDSFYIQTNDDDAIDFKIVKAPVIAPGRENWVDWLPARAGVFLRTFVALKDFVVRLETKDALPRIVISDWSRRKERTLKFDEAAYALSIDGGYEFDSGVIRVAYASPATPQEVMDVNLRTNARTTVKVQEIPSGHNPDDYVVERMTLPMRDGAETPVTILRRKSTKFNARAPMFLYGYGAYGISIPADFNARSLSLVDRGVVYVTAHVRGGADKGRGWYLDGKLENKQNSFNDFVDVAAELHRQGKSAPARTVIFGGSAGGLLVGAAVNQAPERFAGVIGAVPFVDVLNTISDADLPLTPPEWLEWGDPIRDKGAFERIRSYSPYDNIDPTRHYPPILATGGIADYRVTYWEPAKWIARLREEAKGGPFFLRMDMSAGHAGSAARFERLREFAEYYAFALEVFGLAEPRRKG
ncbi:MAG: prolyl oligopeptidase family serine peptidase [Alphaproteobacteria bacterium]|nr:prolyl oligopeptidase family serine peptidase [Alphaproteobacteria bacterium]